MKRKFLTIVSFLAAMIVSLCVLVACDLGGNNGLQVSVEKGETTVLIQVESGATATTTLMDAMELLQEKGELSYTLSGTMVQSMEGKENAADWSACWMLYTTDTEMGNAEWGTYEYGGQTYLSAILGADSLTVLDGVNYLWVYLSF